MATTTAMRVWVGCLACYNAGALIGDWYDAGEAGELTVRQVHGGRDVPHEELWVFDHEGFAGLIAGECAPVEAQRVAEIAAELDDDDREGYAAYVADYGLAVDVDTLEAWRDDYCGVWDSREEYAQHLADELGNAPEGWPWSYIDWERAARDLFMDYGDAPASGGRIHVWRLS